MKKKSIKLAASLLALCVSTASIGTYGTAFEKLSLIPTISASAATYQDGDFKYTKYASGDICITEYCGNASSVVLPAKLGGKYVIAVSSDAFDGTPTNTLSFESGSKYCSGGQIDGFDNMKQLKKITLPSDCTSIGPQAFSGCTNLTTVNGLGSVSIVKTKAFKNCTSLKNIQFGKSLTKIQNNAFENCTSLDNITLQAATEIESHAFDSCKSLTSINFPKGSIVERNAFFDSGLTNIIIPTDFQDADLAKFDRDAFSYCPKLDHINYTVPYTVSSYTSKPTLYEPLKKYSTSLFQYGKSVKWVTDYMNYTAKYVIKTIKNQNPFISDVQMAVKLHDWLCDNTEYDDEKVEEDTDDDLQYAGSVFLNGKTVCAGYAQAYKVLLNAAGIECYCVVVPNVHEWNIVKLNGNWFHVDATWDDQLSNYSYFMLTDAERRKSYSTWDVWSNDTTDPSCNTPMGDLNGDKKVDNTDVQKLRKYLLGNNNQISSAYAYLADMDFDGSITSLDLVKLQRKAKNQ